MCLIINHENATTITVGDVRIDVRTGFVEKRRELIAAVKKFSNVYSEGTLLKKYGAPMTTLNNGNNYTISQAILDKYKGDATSAVIYVAMGYMGDLAEGFSIMDPSWGLCMDLFCDIIIAPEEALTSLKKAVALKDKAWDYFMDFQDNELPIHRIEMNRLHSETLRYYEMASRARDSGTYVLAPSVGALIANKMMYEHVSEQADRYSQQARDASKQRDDQDYLFWSKHIHQATLGIINFAKAAAEIFLGDGSKLAVIVSGPGSESREWQNIRIAPCSPESYVDLLNIIDSSEELNKLLDFFEVDKKALVAPCQRRLASALSRNGNIGESFEAAKQKYALMLKNLRYISNATQLDVFSDILRERMDAALARLSQFSYELPNSLVNRNMSDEEITQQATRLTRNLISREDFQFFHSTFGPEWQKELASRIPHGSDAPLEYDGIIELYRRRISEATGLRQKKDAEISLLEEQKRELLNELASKSFFAIRAKKELRQQIEEKRLEIKRRTETYQKELHTI